jgi:hypothetical protein
LGFSVGKSHLETPLTIGLDLMKAIFKKSKECISRSWHKKSENVEIKWSFPSQTNCSCAGLPDGTCISKQKIPIWVYYRVLGMEYIGVSCSHLIHFTVIWYILWPFDIHILWSFGVFCGNKLYISSFWYIDRIKIWQPCSSGGGQTFDPQIEWNDPFIPSINLANKPLTENLIKSIFVPRLYCSAF